MRREKSSVQRGVLTTAGLLSAIALSSGFVGAGEMNIYLDGTLSNRGKAALPTGTKRDAGAPELTR